MLLGGFVQGELLGNSQMYQLLITFYGNKPYPHVYKHMRSLNENLGNVYLFSLFLTTIRISDTDLRLEEMKDYKKTINQLLQVIL